MSVGQCRMCLNKEELVSSHLMPAALYRHCRTSRLEPVMVTTSVAMHTSRQTQHYLLCGRCEDALNKGGETWVLPRLATIDKRFPLYEILTSAKPEFDEQGWAMYLGANVSGFLPDKITHFAMGLFWKASIHSWKRQGGPKIELGPDSDAIRRYLRGDAAFPSNLTLTVIVTPPSVAMISFLQPYETPKEDAWRNYVCYVPGMFVVMRVGKTISETLRRFCFAAQTGHPIWVSTDMAGKVEDVVKSAFATAHKARGLLESRRKRT